MFVTRPSVHVNSILTAVSSLTSAGYFLALEIKSFRQFPANPRTRAGGIVSISNLHATRNTSIQ